MHPLVGTGSSCAYITLDVAGQINTTLHVLTLNELKHDVAFRRFGVEPLIGLAITFLHGYDRVFTHSHIKIVLGAVHTQRISLETAGYLPPGQRVGMHRDEEIGVGPIGYLRPLVERHKHISLARINNSDIGTVAFHIPPESQSDIQIDIFLL